MTWPNYDGPHPYTLLAVALATIAVLLAVYLTGPHPIGPTTPNPAATDATATTVEQLGATP